MSGASPHPSQTAAQRIPLSMYITYPHAPCRAAQPMMVPRARGKQSHIDNARTLHSASTHLQNATPRGARRDHRPRSCPLVALAVHPTVVQQQPAAAASQPAHTSSTPIRRQGGDAWRMQIQSHRRRQRRRQRASAQAKYVMEPLAPPRRGGVAESFQPPAARELPAWLGVRCLRVRRQRTPWPLTRARWVHRWRRRPWRRPARARARWRSRRGSRSPTRPSAA